MVEQMLLKEDLVQGGSIWGFSRIAPRKGTRQLNPQGRAGGNGKGGGLDKAKVIDARKLEMAYFKERGVYTKVPRRKLNWICLTNKLVP